MNTFSLNAVLITLLRHIKANIPSNPALPLAFCQFFLSTTFAETSASHPEPISILPAPFIENNKEEILLGKKLFNDVRLSRDNSIACSSCHVVKDGGDDGLRYSVGVDGRVGRLNAPTVINSVFNLAQFWDGRATTLADQVSGPIHNPIEMDSDWEQVINKLSKDQKILDDFNAVYSQSVTAENITQAIVAYEKSLIAYNSPFDRFLLGDDAAISERAKRGFIAFKNKGCVSCHQGKNVGGNMYQVFGIVGNYFKDRGDINREDLGRFNVTGKETDRHRFKVPSLRTVVDTAPYFHDGSEPTLEGAVVKMARYQLGRPISNEEVTNIIEFLKSLNGELERDLL